MVSVGTFLTIGIIGAVGVLGYVLYRNADKLGGALSSVVETKLTNPFGDYLENLSNSFTGSGGATTPAGATTPGDPSAPAFGFVQEAVAQTPDASTSITPQYAVTLTDKYGAVAQEKAKVALEMFAPTSQGILIDKATALAEQSPTPLLTQAYSIVDQARVSVGGAEPLTNKFYRLFSLSNKPAPGFEGKILPLSSEAVQAYAKLKIIAREVYL